MTQTAAHPRSRHAALRSRRRLAAMVAAALLIGVAIGLWLAHGSGQTRLAPARGPTGDPLAWRPGEDATFAARAAAGEAQVLYAKSPGGAVASARRVARWRPLVESAARRHGVAPDDLEALVLLESAGRPGVCASSDLSGACGLTQILAGTGTQLLHMRVTWRRAAASHAASRRPSAADAPRSRGGCPGAAGQWISASTPRTPSTPPAATSSSPARSSA